MDDQTQLDAPVTPAPVFAYRALKAVLWGEEETPEKPSTGRQVVSEKDTKGVLHAQFQSKESPLRLSPTRRSKRKILSQPSPTKSILRTPGAHTPRRAMLRDINVTFKDIRKSISPEVMQKALKQQSAADLGLGNNRQECDGALKVVASLGPTLCPDFDVTARELPLNAHKTATSSAPLPFQDDGDLVFDAASYMRMTEKEMKKLIKYGQKMREYARRKDEENDKLRGLLEEARLQNDQLRRQIDRSKSARGSKREVEIFEEGGKSRVNLEVIRSSDANKDTGRSHGKKSTLESHAREERPHLQPISESEPRDQHTTKNIPTTTNKRTRSTNLHSSKDLNNPNLNDVESTSKRPKYEPSPTPREAPNRQPSRQAESTLDLPLRPSQAPIPPTTNIDPALNHLPQDRLEAARERIRKRTELRKTSNGGSGGEGVENLPPPSSLQPLKSIPRSEVVESSTVDWDWRGL